MTIQTDKYLSREKAIEIIDSLPISTPGNIYIEDICYLMGISEIQKSEQLTNADGLMIRMGEIGRIKYSKKVEPHKERYRFTIAHELGHFILHKNECNYFACSEKNMFAWHNNEKKYELEVSANIFAAEILMPEKFASAFIKKADVDLDSIISLSQAFTTSITASSIRFTDLRENDACAIVMTKDSRIEWFRPSREFSYWVKVKSTITSDSYVYNYFQDGNLPKKPENVNVTAWIEGENINNKASILEHSIALSKSHVLTLLFVDEPIENDNEELLTELNPEEDLPYL